MDTSRETKQAAMDEIPQSQETRLLNCWEVNSCGREPGGRRVAAEGVCQAALAEEHNGVNGGINGGRHCWRISGTVYEGDMQGSIANKLAHCAHCRFFSRVLNEMGENHVI